jgi:hypothetical protein
MGRADMFGSDEPDLDLTDFQPKPTRRSKKPTRGSR